MYKAYVEANMLDEDTAQWLSEDADWLQSQWPECVRQAENAGKTVSGNPAFVKFEFLYDTQDGKLYDFEFDVPTSN
jgi:hypothetical protein